LLTKFHKIFNVAVQCLWHSECDIESQLAEDSCQR